MMFEVGCLMSDVWCWISSQGEAVFRNSCLRKLRQPIFTCPQCYTQRCSRVADRGLRAGSELVVLVFELDVERGERSVTVGNILLQIELVGFAQFVARVHLLLETSQIRILRIHSIA